MGRLLLVVSADLTPLSVSSFDTEHYFEAEMLGNCDKGTAIMSRAPIVVVLISLPKIAVFDSKQRSPTLSEIGECVWL